MTVADETTTTADEPAEVDTTPEPTETTDRTFSQTELDAIVERRLAKERAKFADYGDLKSAAEKLRELEDAQRSDVERATAAAQEADERARQAEERYRTALIASAVATEAAKAGADPDVVGRLIDPGTLDLNDDGTVTGVDTAVTALLASKPYLRRPTPGSFDGGARGESGPPTFTRTQLRDPAFYAANKDEILKAANEGRIVNE